MVLGAWLIYGLQRYADAVASTFSALAKANM